MADRPFELQSRDEEILAATIDGTEYTDEPQSRIEYLLLELKKAIEDGGGFTPTQEQLNAMNSGIDSTKVAQIATNASDISEIQDTIGDINTVLEEVL